MWTLTEYFIMGENLLKEIEKGSKDGCDEEENHYPLIFIMEALRLLI